MTSKRILLVDDEEFILDTYSSLLSERGYHVITALSGRKAFQKFSEQSCDLVITDLAMDDGDGFTLIVDIKDKSDHTPIIVFSGRKYKKGKEFVSLLGAQAFIEKPCSSEAFITCVNNIMRAMT